MVKVQRVGRPFTPTPLGDWVSCDGLTLPIYLSEQEVEGGSYWYGCGDAHPYTEEAENCGTVGCHARAGDDRAATLTYDFGWWSLSSWR